MEVWLVATEDEEKPFAFAPAELVVRAGTTVRWVNAKDVFHTVTFSDAPEPRVPNGAFDRSLASAGDAVEFTFARPGTYHYYCQPHSGFMTARILVR